MEVCTYERFWNVNLHSIQSPSSPNLRKPAIEDPASSGIQKIQSVALPYAFVRVIHGKKNPEKFPIPP
ncbi:hypothetical protein KKB18_11105 [bacterium]|nr:hypothetical protein [bacterium]